MSLTIADKKYIQETVVAAILEAIETLVNPRFDRLEKGLEEAKFELKEDIRMLQADMREVNAKIVVIDGRLQAVESDVKELYQMCDKRLPKFFTSKQYASLSVEEKLVILEKEIEIIAESEGILLTYLRAK